MSKIIAAAYKMCNVLNDFSHKHSPLAANCEKTYILF
jgi:hypothetical protein